MIDHLARACNLAGVDYDTFLKIKAYMPVQSAQAGIRVRAWTDNDDIHASTSTAPANAMLILDEGDGL